MYISTECDTIVHCNTQFCREFIVPSITAWCIAIKSTIQLSACEKQSTRRQIMG